MRFDAQRTFDAKRLGVAGIWATLIAIVLLLPAGAVPKTPSWLPPELVTWVEWTVHFGLFFWLAWLLTRAVLPGSSTHRWLLPALSVAYAVILEFLQVPVPGRGFELADIAFAVLGIACAELLAYWWDRRSK